MSDEVVVGEDGEYGVAGLCRSIAVSCRLIRFQSARRCEEQYAIVRSFCETCLWVCSAVCIDQQGESANSANRAHP